MIGNVSSMSEVIMSGGAIVNPVGFLEIFEWLAAAGEGVLALFAANPITLVVGGVAIVAIGGTTYYINKKSAEENHEQGEIEDEKTDTSTWGNPDTLDDHYERHGEDVGASYAEDYAEKAHDFYENRDNYQVKVDEEGTIRVYDPKTNTFGSYNPDGSTKTYFKPTGGQNYFDKQPGK